ncbi:MAG: repeat containing protein, partial [Cyanobacteria bacterium RYN_339]|nr:repeat containing protein [Cyanobacteria bacterium RYN_339]
SLFALAKMPGASSPVPPSVTADVDTATTAVTCYVKDEITKGKVLADIDMAGYAADVAALTAGMTQAQASAAAGSSVPVVAAFVRAYFAGVGSAPQVFPPPPPPKFTFINTVAGTAAHFSLPVGLARDAGGSLYIAEQGTSQIWKILPSGALSVLAGAGGTGFADGAGPTALFNQPQGLAVDASQNVYVADRFNQRIRKISPAGVVTTLAGNGATGAGDGPAAGATFWNPFGVAVDAAGNVYVADRSNNLIRKVTAAGMVTTLASGFQYPESLAVDPAGNVIVADRANHRLKKITPDGTVSTLLGNGTPGHVDGPVASARIDSPYNVMVDPAGNVYFTCRNPSSGMNTVRVLTPGGLVATVAGAPAPATGASVDGPIATARLSQPWGLALAPDGRLFMTEMGSGSLRVLVP